METNGQVYTKGYRTLVVYGDGCALLSGLLLVILPLSAYFGFDLWMVLLGLWALWRYLSLIGRRPVCLIEMLSACGKSLIWPK